MLYFSLKAPNNFSGVFLKYIFDMHLFRAESNSDFLKNVIDFNLDFIIAHFIATANRSQVWMAKGQDVNKEIAYDSSTTMNMNFMIQNI